MEEMQHHEQWYTEYAKLLANKKSAIEEWKKAKDVGINSELYDYILHIEISFAINRKKK